MDSVEAMNTPQAKIGRAYRALRQLRRRTGAVMFHDLICLAEETNESTESMYLSGLLDAGNLAARFETVAKFIITIGEACDYLDSMEEMRSLSLNPPLRTGEVEPKITNQ